jgi:hypothetical protein
MEFLFLQWRRGLQAAAALRKQVLPQCALADCPKRHRMLSVYWMRSSGTEFDGRWYCSMECLQRAVRLAVQNHISRFLFERPRSYRLPVGLLLVNRGQITNAQLQEALRLQREHRSGRIGTWLRQMNATTDHEIVKALAQQWACPVYPLDRHPQVVSWTDVAPFTLFAAAKAVPVHLSLDGRTLHVAFSERVDHTLLYALERMLDCRTIACVASESAVNAMLEAKGLAADRSDINFETLRDAGGIASAICSYVQQIEAPQLKLERAGPYLWARLTRSGDFRDLLFRILPATNPTLEPPARAPKGFSTSADVSQEGVAGQPLPV